MFALIVLYTYTGIYSSRKKKCRLLSNTINIKRKKKCMIYLSPSFFLSKLSAKPSARVYTTYQSTYIAISFASIRVSFLLFYFSSYSFTCFNHILMLNVCILYTYIRIRVIMIITSITTKACKRISTSYL
jgi:hypothetical protein